MAALTLVTSTIHPMAARPTKGTKTEMAMMSRIALRGTPSGVVRAKRSGRISSCARLRKSELAER